MVTQSIIELLDAAVERYDERVAAIHSGDSFTYRELAELIERFSRHLRERFAAGPGDRVALVMPNCLHSVVCYLGVIRTGAIAVPINIRLKPEEMRFILDDVGARVVIAHGRTWATVSDAMEGLADIDAVIGVDLDAPGVVPVGELTEPGAPDFDVPRMGPDDIAAIIYTSGTTGLPKGAMISHGNVLFNVKSTISGHGFRPDDVHILVVPLFHVTGLNTILPTSLHLGSTVIITDRTNPSDLLDLIEAHRATTFFSVPTTMILLTRLTDIGERDLSSLRLVAYSGAPMPVQTIDRLRELLPGVALHNFFGLTETTSVTTVMPDEFAISHAESIGRLVPGLEARIVDDAGGDLPDGWLHTGDTALMDADGFIFLRGRTKEMIIVAGENVYPVEVENLLTRHPGILEAAAIGAPHPVLGEVVKAVVVRQPGAELDEREVKRHCTRSLASFKVPQIVEFVDALPRNPSGKVVKREL
jgi:long-chain acyl-CoA synthetase